MRQRATFEVFVASRAPKILRWATALSGGDQLRAEDLAQTALMRLAVRWPRVDSPDAYVYETLSHLAIDHHRLSSTRHEYVAGDLTQFDALAAPDGPESAEIREDLMSALRALPPAQRATVALRYLCDQDERETARLLGCSVGAVKSQTSRGLVRLRELVSRTSRGSASEPCPTDTSTARRGS